MRLVDIDKVRKDICTLYNSNKDRNPSEKDVMRVIDSQEVIESTQQVEKVKADLRNILDSYFTPHFIDAAEMDVDKFKAEMSKAQLRAMPSEDKFDKFCQLYENWMEDKKLGVQDVGRRDIITKCVYPSYISIDDVNHLIAIVKKGE